MLLKYRLEMLLIILIGMHMHSNHLVLTILFLGLTFLELAMSIVIYKNLLTNPKRIESLLKEQLELKNRKKTKKEIFLKVEFWFVMAGIVVMSILTYSIFIIALAMLTILLEIGKLYIFKRLKNKSLI